MIYAIVALSVILVLEIIAHSRERTKAEDERNSMIELWTHERAADAVAAQNERQLLLEQLQRLADRIQHPDIRQVEPGASLPPLPDDSAEMAFVGQEVPTGIIVGSQDGGSDG